MNATIEEMKQAIRESSKTSKIYVGCDSQINRRKNKVTYAIVVVIHWDGKHGGHILSQIETERVYGEAKKPAARLRGELYRVTELALKLVEDVGDRDFELHFDFNQNPLHKSEVCVKEAAGYVMGLGLGPAVFKPDSWASTSAADRLC